jgi:predicted DCC family thiol-disulfide oxidoreductase YuxK
VNTARADAVLLYDGDCAFCSSSARLLRRLVRRLPPVEPYQFADLEALGVSAEECAASVQWVSADGRRAEGHRAIAQVLVDAGRGWTVLGRVLGLPGVSWLAGVTYRWIARNRYRLPGGTPACALPRDGSATTS